MGKDGKRYEKIGIDAERWEKMGIDGGCIEEHGELTEKL